MLSDKIKNGENISVDDGNITIVNSISLKEKEEVKTEEETPDVKLPEASEVDVSSVNDTVTPIIPTTEENAPITPDVTLTNPIPVEAPIPDTAAPSLDSVLQSMNTVNSISTANNDELNNLNQNITPEQNNIPVFDGNTFSYNVSQNQEPYQNTNSGYDFNNYNQNNSYTMPSGNFNNPLEEMNNYVNSLIKVINELSNWSNQVADNGYVNRQSIESLTEINGEISSLGIQNSVNSNTRRF